MQDILHVPACVWGRQCGAERCALCCSPERAAGSAEGDLLCTRWVHGCLLLWRWPPWLLGTAEKGPSQVPQHVMRRLNMLCHLQILYH